MKVVYILDVFPKISETFIVEEIVEILKNNIDVEIIALRKVKTEKIPDKYFKYKLYERTIYAADIKFDRELMYHLITKKSLLQEVVINSRDIYFLTDIIKIVKYLGDKKISLIHAHYGNQPAYVASIVAKIIGVPFTFTTHAHDIYGRHANIRYLKTALERCSRSITISEYNKIHLLKLMTDGTKVKVINCGIDLDDFTPQRARVNEFRMLTVGRLVEKKGITHAIAAMNLLKKNNINIKYIIVGDGPDKPKLAELIDKSDLNDRISLIGNITDEELKIQYNNANAFILPAIIAKDGDRDGIPIVLMEAMAMKLPVISTTVSGIPELVTEDCGIMVEPSDDNGLAEAIERLYRLPDLCIKMGENGRRRIEEHFDAKKNYYMLAETFKEIVKNGKNNPDVAG